jgi:DNA-binding transcriptional LysR family regulator
MAFDTRLLTGVGVLAAVTEAGNFARAAEMLGLTPSAVSRAVARLEARVGVRLFDRNPREVSLTEEGRRFHTQVMRCSLAWTRRRPRPQARRRSCAAGCAYR